MGQLRALLISAVSDKLKPRHDAEQQEQTPEKEGSPPVCWYFSGAGDSGELIVCAKRMTLGPSAFEEVDSGLSRVLQIPPDLY